MGRTRIPAAILLAIAACAATGCALDTPVVQRGASQRTGVLLNYSRGADPCDAIDPAKPTIVITHGWNPLPKQIRCTLGPSGAAALRRRCGDRYNLLSWDWNAVPVSPFFNEPVRIGREQGRMLAAALCRRGVVPGRTQIIAHSLGNLAAAQAAQCLAHSRGRVLQLTLLDPPTQLNEEIFDKLCPTRHACIVENYYNDTPGGFGERVDRPGVRNYFVAGVYPVLGAIDLSRSDHVHVMRWYYETMRCPQMKYGFQTSALLCECGRGGACYECDDVLATSATDEPSDGRIVNLAQPSGIQPAVMSAGSRKR
ncbi:MAG: hypothetical protein CMJ58_23955 [Planctomycetaceae bacterium]|nr:hypothetical protein [Planctomycetaceae bacterium]